MSATAASPTSAGAIAPTLALQLRLSHLQSLIGHAPGPTPTSSAAPQDLDQTQVQSDPQPILLRALAAKQLLETSASTHSSLRKFLRDFDANRRLLDGGFRYDARSSSDVARDATRFLPLSLSLSLDASGDEQSGSGSREAVLTTQEQILLVVDAEKDMRTLERMLLECEALDRRGVAGAGKMAGEFAVYCSESEQASNSGPKD